jgi:HAD superfamily hydrolase (TIGR01509 family)
VVDAVVFDLDGVLIDSEPVWEQVRRGLVRDAGGVWPPDAQQRLMGMSTSEWARYLSNDLGTGLSPDETAAVVVERMQARYRERLPLLPGAADAVRRLSGRWSLGLASASPRDLIDTVLDLSGLAPSFDAVVSADDVAHGKPDPDVYREACRRLGASASNCVAIEDSANGIRAAIAAGVRVIAVPQERYPVDDDVLAHAAVVIDDLDKLTTQTVTIAAGGVR